MPQTQGDAQCTTRITGGWLNPNLIEHPISQDATVSDTVERDAAGEAQVAHAGFASCEAAHLEHDFFGDVLNRPREVHFALRQLGFGLAGRAIEEFLES